MFTVSLIHILEQRYPVCRVWAAFTMDIREEIFERLIKIANIEDIIISIKLSLVIALWGKKN